MPHAIMRRQIAIPCQQGTFNHSLQSTRFPFCFTNRATLFLVCRRFHSLKHRCNDFKSLSRYCFLNFLFFEIACWFERMDSASFSRTRYGVRRTKVLCVFLQEPLNQLMLRRYRPQSHQRQSRQRQLPATLRSKDECSVSTPMFSSADLVTQCKVARFIYRPLLTFVRLIRN